MVEAAAENNGKGCEAGVVDYMRGIPQPSTLKLLRSSVRALSEAQRPR